MNAVRMGLAAALTLAMAGVVPAASQPADPVAEFYNQALTAAANQDWPAYLSAVDQALVHAPQQPVLLRRRAEALAQLGRTGEALAIVRALAGWGAKLRLEETALLEPLRALPAWAEVRAIAAASAGPKGGCEPSFSAPEDDLIPEGIAWDPVDDVFYLGSVACRKIVRVDRAGRARDFIAPGQDGYLSGLGLAVDASRRRLWTVSNAAADAGLFDAAAVPTSAVHVFDLKTGALLWKHVTALADSFDLNDICVLPDGGAAASVSTRGLVLLFGPDGGEPRALCAPGSLPGANGLCVGPRGDRLYVSAYSYGVMQVDLATGAVTPATSPAAVPAAFTTAWVDGLYAFAGGLLAVQNFLGIDRVVVFTLDAAGLIGGCRVLVARQEFFVDPTTGALAPDGFHFIANSYVTPFYERQDKSVLTGFGRTRVMRVGVE